MRSRPEPPPLAKPRLFFSQPEDVTVVSLSVFVRPNEADLAAASVPEFLKGPDTFSLATFSLA
jgi:hypothetical protein